MCGLLIYFFYSLYWTFMYHPAPPSTSLLVAHSKKKKSLVCAMSVYVWIKSYIIWSRHAVYKRILCPSVLYHSRTGCVCVCRTLKSENYLLLICQRNRMCVTYFCFSFPWTYPHLRYSVVVIITFLHFCSPTGLSSISFLSEHVLHTFWFDSTCFACIDSSCYCC